MSRVHYSRSVGDIELMIMPADMIGSNYHKAGIFQGYDSAEAGSTALVLAATGHIAQAGDVIVFTSGSLEREAREVASTTTNTITLSTAFSGAPATADTFGILRPVAAKQAVGLHIDNDTDRRILISFDGSVNKMTVPATGSLTRDLASNNRRMGFKYLPHGPTEEEEYVYVKYHVLAPVLENLFIEIIQ